MHSSYFQISYKHNKYLYPHIYILLNPSHNVKEKLTGEQNKNILLQLCLVYWPQGEEWY